MFDLPMQVRTHDRQLPGARDPSLSELPVRQKGSARSVRELGGGLAGLPEHITGAEESQLAEMTSVGRRAAGRRLPGSAGLPCPALGSIIPAITRRRIAAAEDGIQPAWAWRASPAALLG